MADDKKLDKEKINFISIILLCRNEEKFIGKCLDSILAQDYPKDKMEALVVDGMSSDKTREIVKEYAQKGNTVNLIDNHSFTAPAGMNVGIKEAKGQAVVIMGAHAIYAKDYVSKCVKYLNQYNADAVGGLMQTLSGSKTLKAKAIALALSSSFGVGNSYFRTGVKEPKLVDTVPFGCYRKEVFDKIGNFNKNLTRNHDIEFNLRLKKAGGKILLVPDIKSYYYARATFRELFRNNFQNGFWVIYSTKFAKLPFSLRHLVPFIFVSSLFISLILSLLSFEFLYLFSLIFGLYLLFNFTVSLMIAIKNGLGYFPFLLISFLTLHFSYGLGSIWGIVRLILIERRKI